jgi:hypothetical protein
MMHDEPEPEKGIIRTLKPAVAVEHTSSTIVVACFYSIPP